MMEIDKAVLKAVGKLEPKAYAFPVHAEIIPMLDQRPSLGALYISIRFLEGRGLIEVATGNLMRLTSEGRKLTI